MSDDLTPQQRLALITLVGSLPDAVFKRLIFASKAPRDLIASNAAAQGDRAADLLDWVEGPLGCRLEAFLPLLEEVAPKAFQEALGGRSNLESETAEPFPQPDNPPQASNYYDLRGANFSGGFAETVEGHQVGGNQTNHKQSFQQQSPGAPFLAPPLPRHYVPRPEHLNAVKAKLLDDAQPGTLVISAIYGMGGIGKSVLAAALVQEPEVQQRFTDGILWVTLGQQPDLLSMVNLWIRELGDYDYNPTTLDAASLHLRTLLADKCTLLVVDDVWNPEHVKPFRIGGAGCCVLVTTRQTLISGATRYDLDLMTPQQSLTLLTQYLPRELEDTEQAQAAAFAEEVGYLPLALELAAAQIEQGVTWTELTEAFRAEMAVLDLDSDVEAIGDEATRKQRSLVASFKLTLKLLSAKQLAQFAWLGIVPEDVTLTQQMAATLWQVNSFQAGKLLRELKNRALLLPQAQRPGEKPTYRIHDLVHDLAQTLLTQEQCLGELPGLGLSLKDAHQQFLGHYHAQTRDGLWHTVPDDGYIHRHLAWHFEQAQQPELLHQLLREPTAEGRNGWYESCERLGQTANFVTDVARAWAAAEALYAHNAVESIALQLRYGLITTTLNSLAQNIPPKLMAALVKKGVWQPAQGLAYVRQIQKPEQRAQGLTELLPYLPAALMSEALAVARSIQHEFNRASALRGLAEYLPEVVEEALVVARSIQDESARAFALRGLAQYLPEALMSEALSVARSIQKESARASALRGLAQYLPEALMSEALSVARSIQNEYDRASALRGLAEYLPEVVEEALAVARSIQSESDRARALIGLAEYLPEVVEEALSVARSIQSESGRASALRGLAEYLPEVVEEALVLARSIQKESARASALRGLAQYLPEALMSEALSVARSIQSESSRASALIGLAEYLPEVVEEALVVARSIQKESFRAFALIGLAEYLPEVVEEALAVACSTQDEFCRARALSDLAEYLPAALMSEALAVARSIQSESSRARALRGLAEYLPEVVEEALAVARSIQDEYARASALIGLAKYLPEVMEEALAVARSIQSESSRARALRGLAEYLPAALMSEALAVARSIQDEYARASALRGLAEYLPAALMSEALAVARSIQHEFNRAFALRGLAEYLPEVVEEALTVACSIQDEYDRASALRGLAEYLPAALMSEALAVARSIQDESSRASALRGLAEYLPEVVEEALAVARSIQDESSRASALRGLAEYLPAALMSEALAVARSIQDEYARADALSGLAEYLPAALMSEALAVARSIQSESDRAYALSGLAEYLPAALMSEALAVARSIQDEYYRADALSGLLAQLATIKTNIVLWQEVLHGLAYHDRKSFLTEIPKLALALSGDDKTVLKRVVEAMREVCCQWP